MQRQAYWIALGVVLAALLVWLAFFWEPQPPGNVPLTQPHGLAQPAGQPVGGNFTLDSPQGKLSLSTYRGKVVLLYFGYTFCPDVCPTALAIMAQAFAALAPGELEQVRGIFVSVDPERDTMEVLQAYAPFFHPVIVGASGTPEQVAEVARRYGVSYMKQKAIDGRPYTVDHSSATYLIAADGRLVSVLPHGLPAAEVVAAIRSRLAVPVKQ